MEPPVGFAPTWTCLQDRCLSVSATEESSEWCSREDLHLEPPLPQSGVHVLLHFGSL